MFKLMFKSNYYTPVISEIILITKDQLFLRDFLRDFLEFYSFQPSNETTILKELAKHV